MTGDALPPETHATASMRRFAHLRRLAVRIVGAVAALVLGTGVGAAYGYFTSSGQGIGSAITGTMQAVTVSATPGSPTTSLFPGSTSDVAFRVTNPNSFAVRVVSVVGSGPITPDASHSACTTTGVTFLPQTGLSITIPANMTSQEVSLPGAASMSTASVSGCQGATFSIPVTITARSS